MAAKQQPPAWERPRTAPKQGRDRRWGGEPGPAAGLCWSGRGRAAAAAAVGSWRRTRTSWATPRIPATPRDAAACWRGCAAARRRRPPAVPAPAKAHGKRARRPCGAAHQRAATLRQLQHGPCRRPWGTPRRRRRRPSRPKAPRPRPGRRTRGRARRCACRLCRLRAALARPRQLASLTPRRLADSARV